MPIPFPPHALPQTGAPTPAPAEQPARPAAQTGWAARLRHVLTAPRRPQTIALVLALWLTLSANFSLWLRLGQLDGYDGSQLVLMLRMAPMAFFGITLLLSLLAWPRGMKPLWIALLLLAAGAQYFMLTYGTVMDSGMVHNILQTDTHESADLISLRMLLQMLAVVGLPAWWLVQVPVRGSSSALASLARTLGLFVLAASLLLVSVFVSYRDMAPVVRNNLWLRYMLNPVSPVLAVVHSAFKPLLNPQRAFVSISGGAALGTSYAQTAKPPLMVVVVGETARAANWGLNGYARDTNPELASRQALSWRNVQSCGTSTRESVPCMFSHLGRTQFVQSRQDHDNLLDVLQAAGLAVLWVDNQAGCKHVCDRIANASTADHLDSAAGQKLCSSDGECLDGMLLEGLDERIAQLDPVRRARGVVLVLHQMGSHGPAYQKRSSAQTKVFVPECTTNALSSCSREQLLNVYDNSIRYNDWFLSRTIDWLQGQQAHFQTGMLYMSDHGESLGEMGIYLHGMPYALAPQEQKHIPMIAWLGSLGTRTQVSEACLRQRLDKPLSHDNLFHTVLGLLDVKSPSYQPGQDAFGDCRPQA